MTEHDSSYFLKTEGIGYRLYDRDRDEDAVCHLCWKNALPGGRPFPLIPEAGATSFGRIVTGPFAEYAPSLFFVAIDLTTGKLVGYLTGAEGRPVKFGDGKIPWMEWRNRRAQQIAEDEFGDISPKLRLPAQGVFDSVKFLYTISLGPRTIQFLLHEKLDIDKEMPDLPECPEFHFQVVKAHRGQGIGGKLVEHFVNRFRAKKYKEIGVQVTVCDGQVPLAYYERMSVAGEPVWKVYDRRETAMYTAEEKEAWGLGSRVENVSLVADKDRLLAFVRRGNQESV